MSTAAKAAQTGSEGTTNTKESTQGGETTEGKEATAQASGQSEKTGDQSAGKEATKAEGEKQTVKYELKLPKDSLLGADRIEKISAYAKAKGLSNEAAQELLSWESDAVAGFHTAQKQKVEKQSQAWLEELKADGDIGGEKLEGAGREAYRALEKFWGKDFAKVVTEAGLNHHPSFFKGLVKLSKAMSNDSFRDGQPAGSANSKKSTAELFYGSNSKQQ